jgi:hypothetical protein
LQQNARVRLVGQAIQAYIIESTRYMLEIRLLYGNDDRILVGILINKTEKSFIDTV